MKDSFDKLFDELKEHTVSEVDKSGHIHYDVMYIYGPGKKVLWTGSLEDVEKKFGLNMQHLWMGDPIKVLDYLKSYFPDVVAWKIPANIKWNPGDTDTADKALEQPTSAEEIEKNLKELEKENET